MQLSCHFSAMLGTTEVGVLGGSYLGYVNIWRELFIYTFRFLLTGYVGVIKKMQLCVDVEVLLRVLWGYSAATGCAVAFVTVASEYPHSTLKGTLTCSSHRQRYCAIGDLGSRSEESGCRKKKKKGKKKKKKKKHDKLWKRMK